MSTELRITSRKDDQQAAHEAGRVLDDMLYESGNPRVAIYLENAYLCGELVLAALRRAGFLQSNIDSQAFTTALLQVKDDFCSKEDTDELDGTWGSAAGYLTGDAGLLRARGHSEDEIAAIQKSLDETDKPRGE